MLFNPGYKFPTMTSSTGPWRSMRIASAGYTTRPTTHVGCTLIRQVLCNAGCMVPDDGG